mmetsp:Transcript_32721/g.98832  ORF Transcript_32721/g.98832 Transcript_32721/m.98832 type:complete len:271 (+) Transcript_32721:4514-5326(+)
MSQQPGPPAILRPARSPSRLASLPSSPLRVAPTQQSTQGHDPTRKGRCVLPSRAPRTPPQRGRVSCEGLPPSLQVARPHRPTARAQCRAPLPCSLRLQSAQRGQPHRGKAGPARIRQLSPRHGAQSARPREGRPIFRLGRPHVPPRGPRRRGGPPEGPPPPALQLRCPHVVSPTPQAPDPLDRQPPRQTLARRSHRPGAALSLPPALPPRWAASRRHSEAGGLNGLARSSAPPCSSSLSHGPSWPPFSPDLCCDPCRSETGDRRRHRRHW